MRASRRAGAAPAFIAVALMSVAPDTAAAQAQVLELGREIAVVLDDEDTAEIEFRVVLREPRGIYRLELTDVRGGWPGISIVPEDGGGEAVECDAWVMLKPVFVLVLDAGAHLLTASNESDSSRLTFGMRLSLLRPWSASDELEPNDETPRQALQAGRTLAGRLQGPDEDVFIFEVPSHPRAAYDFFVESEAPERMILRVAAEGREEEACRMGVADGKSPAILGLELLPGRYVVSLLRDPSAGTAVVTAGSPPQRLISLEYGLRVAPSAAALKRLVSEDEAARSIFAGTEEGLPVLGMNPRLGREEAIAAGHAERGARLAAWFDGGRPIRKSSSTGNAEELPPAHSSAALLVARPLLESLSRDPVMRGSLARWKRKLGPLTPERARVMAGLWPRWEDLPDDWASEVLDGAAARLLRGFVLRGMRFLDARLVTGEGFVAAAASVPGVFWAGEDETFKAWIGKGRKAAVFEPRLDSASGLRVRDVALPVFESGRVAGVLLATLVLDVH